MDTVPVRDFESLSHLEKIPSELFLMIAEKMVTDVFAVRLVSLLYTYFLSALLCAMRVTEICDNTINNVYVSYLLRKGLLLEFCFVCLKSQADLRYFLVTLIQIDRARYKRLE